MNILAWNRIPPLAELLHTLATRAKPLYWAVCLPEAALPEFRLSAQACETEIRLAQSIAAKLSCLQFNTANALQNVLPDVHLWLFPPECAPHMQAHFPQKIQWQTDSVPQQATALKPWLKPPGDWGAHDRPASKPGSAIVVGAGIAGAATARELAQHGVRITVLEARSTACGGSGNRQGLLYAKLSPHPTEQTDLLLAGYGYTRRLLADLLPDSDAWGGSGVLHLNFDAAERARNQALAAQTRHAHLYRSVCAEEAAQIAGIKIGSDGLYWPQGVWLHPPAFVRALLDHPLIETVEQAPLVSARFDGACWQAHTPRGSFRAEHLIYCTGAHSPNAPEPNVAALPFRQIRGQTGEAKADAFSEKLRCAVSGESYIAPSWQGRHCYGASFVLNCADDTWREAEESANRAALRVLNPALADSLFSDGLNPLSEARGHAALRCDSPDHLPMVGALGDIAAMQTVYAKLALDKNYRLDAPCPYLPNVWLNTAHGTRGLATAPICAASLAAEILALPHPLAPRLRAALHPNRTIIRAIVRRKFLL